MIMMTAFFPSRNGDKETTQTLLSLGADCNISCGDDTPLITALQHGKEEVALMLLGLVQTSRDPTLAMSVCRVIMMMLLLYVNIIYTDFGRFHGCAGVKGERWESCFWWMHPPLGN